MAAHAPPRRWHFFLLATAWTVFAVYGSLVPLDYRPVELADAIERFRNLPPLWFGLGTRADWVANILLFVPLTFFWMGAVACDRGWAARTGAALWLVPLASVASVALEFAQIWFGRTVSRNDVVAETLGASIGAVLWLGIGQRVVAWTRTFNVERRPRAQFEWLLQAYVLGFIIFSVIPLDLTISLTELYHKYKRGQVLLVPFSYAYDSPSTMVYQFFADTVVFVPVGVWAALTQRHRVPIRPPLVAATLVGGLVAAAIEFTQLLVMSRFTDVTDVLLGTLGAAVGAWLVLRNDAHATQPLASGVPAARIRHALPWLAAVAAYSLFLIAGFWFPFELSHDRALIRSRIDGFFGVPFAALYWGTEFNAIKQLLVRVLLFAPLGVMWAHVANLARSTGARRLLGLVGFGYSVALAFGIEAVQILMPSKVADFTEVLLCAAGALGGLLIANRLLGSEATRFDR